MSPTAQKRRKANRKRKTKRIPLPPDAAHEYDQTSQRIRDAIRRRRQDMKLTQDDLAKLIGRKKEYIYAIEHRRKPVDIPLLILVAQALNTTPMALWENHFGKPSNEPVCPER